ncbi:MULTISPECIES: hypothetical protein [Haloferax]|uniref:Small CPxCG-related zinc finger protein n=1 Tax=Haloferax gibbonsii TaxID=35746 RepID=A0A871BIE8_HALGI|nr:MULTISPECIES: hypothetical protein [Haloferax]MCO8267981.1 hypothetical protein [Haloferax sp. AB510]QOS12443.1 small CPxCG-related zinc finger protein [Haloferax gibbonsii]
MSESNENSRIAPYTEYSRTRSRCPRCGTSVPKEAVADALCASCKTDVSI